MRFYVSVDVPSLTRINDRVTCKWEVSEDWFCKYGRVLEGTKDNALARTYRCACYWRWAM